MVEEKQAILVRNNTWIRLNKRKLPKESFDDVINKVLDEADK